jgi:hypothetical protein
MMKIALPALGMSGEAAPVLRALPGWFGIEAATQMYIDAADQKPSILALDIEREKTTVGL